MRDKVTQRVIDIAVTALNQTITACEKSGDAEAVKRVEEARDKILQEYWESRGNE